MLAAIVENMAGDDDVKCGPTAPTITWYTCKQCHLRPLWNSWKEAACYAETFEGCAEKIADHLQHSGLHRMEQEDGLTKEQESKNPPPPPPEEVEAMERAIVWSHSWLPIGACELCGGATVNRYASH